MPTPSYLIAQKIIPQVKAQCPRIVIPCRAPTPASKNSFTFFAGSAYEQTVQFRRMMAHADPFWEPSDHEEMRPWNTRINVAWLTDSYNNVLLDEIYAVMGIQAGTSRYTLEDNLAEISGRAMQIAKIRIWGIPVGLRSETWFFHRIITAGCAKKTLPEAAWKIACTNVGGLYGVNENVVMDAILEQKAYQSLYAIHPLLGRSWVPWVRHLVERATGISADYREYARQLSSALSAHGIHKSGMKTLHRMAETSPMTFRNAMRHLVNTSGLVDASTELTAMLNLLNGQKPTSGVTFSNIIKKVTVHHHEIPARHPEDIRVLVRIDHWLAKDMRFDRGLVFDWMVFLTRERRGSLHRGYLDVTKDLKSPAKLKEAALAWANRSQQYWHRHRLQQAENVYQMERRSLSWKSIMNTPVFPLEIDGVWWQFVELTNSDALQEEGYAMQHCVAGYDEDCHLGQSHIFSVRNAKGCRISTLELRPKRYCRRQPGTRKGDGQYTIAQNRGPQNAVISTDCKKAAELFLKTVNDFLKVAACKADAAGQAQKECA
ncbi:MAG: PcfJ domain-containing protein [Acidithiobacillus sp.]